MTSFLASLAAHPRGFWFVFWGELAERASFYGMRTVLALYLLEILGFEPAGAGSVMTLFLAAAYLTPILGGYIADRWLGRFGTIAAFALPYLAGTWCSPPCRRAPGWASRWCCWRSARARSSPTPARSWA